MAGKQRFDYLDVSKGIGILLVVWAHILLVGWTHRLIYAFHMPLFFLISGMLYDRDKYLTFGDFFRARFKRLIVPYLIYSVVTWAIWAVFRYLQGGPVVSYWRPLLQTVIAQGSGAFMVHNSPLWFIPCLFAVEIMYFFVSKAKEGMTLMLCVLIAAGGVALTHLYGNDYLFLLPWNLDAAFYGLLFYGVGHGYRHYVGHEKTMQWVGNNGLKAGLLSLVLLVVLWLLAMNFGECSMGSSSYQCAEWLFFVRAFVGCVWLILTCAILCSTPRLQAIIRPLKWCGVNSLDIMCLHVPIKGVAIIGLTILFHLSRAVSESAPLSAIVFALTIVACVILTMLINRFIRKR